ncbi:MAG: hypothetical protein MR051_04450 [Lentisphaeria bacterium]|nr:hypothetical protein [Lentisphaeria bacterium]
MIRRRVFLLLVLSVGAFASGAPANAELPMRDFLLRSRRSNPIATYARLDGSLQHRRRGRDGIVEMPIYFGVILHPDRTVGQLILDGNEAYLLGQGKGVGVTSISRMSGGAPGDKLGYVGVRAGDLMLSFLFCQPLRELEGETLRGIVPCRVFELDDPSNKETVKVWISREHAFPLRAEFTRYGENTPFRELEAGALTKKNDLYYIRQIRLSGPGWSTRIDFDADRAEIAPLPASGSARIFRKLPSQ